MSSLYPQADIHEMVKEEVQKDLTPEFSPVLEEKLVQTSQRKNYPRMKNIRLLGEHQMRIGCISWK